MRKTFKLLLVGLIVLCALILLNNNQVFATSEIVGNGADLKTKLEEGKSVILSGKITDLATSIEIDDTVTIDGAGHSIEVSTFKSIFKLNEGANVTFKDITIKNTFGDGRCIDIRQGNVKLILDTVVLETTTTSTNDGHDRPLNIGGNF